MCKRWRLHVHSHLYKTYVHVPLNSLTQWPQCNVRSDKPLFLLPLGQWGTFPANCGDSDENKNRCDRNEVSHVSSQRLWIECIRYPWYLSITWSILIDFLCSHRRFLLVVRTWSHCVNTRTDKYHVECCGEKHTHIIDFYSIVINGAWFVVIGDSK